MQHGIFIEFILKKIYQLSNTGLQVNPHAYSDSASEGSASVWSPIPKLLAAFDINFVRTLPSSQLRGRLREDVSNMTTVGFLVRVIDFYL